MTLPVESPRGTAALAASAEWRLLSLLLERPRDGWLHEIESLSHEVEASDLQRAVAEANEAGEAAYLETFGPGGRVSPREAAYRGREDLGHIVADIAVFHEVFAFRPQAEDPLDHVAVEASLVAYLHLKEAYARALGDVEAAQTAAKAAERFIEAHLRIFAEPLAERLEATAAPLHLVRTAQALVARVGPAPDASRSAAPDDTGREFECGGCELPPTSP